MGDGGSYCWRRGLDVGDEAGAVGRAVAEGLDLDLDFGTGKEGGKGSDGVVTCGEVVPGEVGVGGNFGVEAPSALTQAENKGPHQVDSASAACEYDATTCPSDPAMALELAAHRYPSSDW